MRNEKVHHLAVLDNDFGCRVSTRRREQLTQGGSGASVREEEETASRAGRPVEEDGKKVEQQQKAASYDLRQDKKQTKGVGF